MKKIFGILFVIIILGCAGYFVYINYIKDSIPKIKMEEETANINEYYIYGNHFNIKGKILTVSIQVHRCTNVWVRDRMRCKRNEKTPA